MPAKTLERVASFRVEVDPTEDVITATRSRKKNKTMANNQDHVVEEERNVGLSPDIDRINERMDHAVEHVAKTQTTHIVNRSGDLILLTGDYVRMKNDLKALLRVLLTYQKCTRDLQEARLKIAEQMSLFSKQTPIHEEVSRELDGETTEKFHLLSQLSSSSSSSSSSTTSSSSSISTPKSPTSISSFFLHSMGIVKEEDSRPTVVNQISEDYRNRNGANALSLYGVFSLGAAQAVRNDSEYQLNIVEYTTKWIEVVTERVDAGLKNVRKLASERLHYERKIETLRNKVNDLEKKGKSSPNSAIERLSRNETKLKEAFEVHEKEAGKLCALIETVTQEGYKDLYILVRNYIQWEQDRVGSESDISFQLKLTLDALNKKFNQGDGSTSAFL